MGFYDVLEQAMVLLQRHGRVSYRALKRHFALDDAYLEDLKAEILYVHPSVVDDADKGLVWAEGLVASDTNVRHVVDAESRLQALLPSVVALLRQEGRVTYRTLQYVFGLDRTLLEAIREELTLRQAAVDDEGKVLVWTGQPHPPLPAAQPQHTTDTAVTQSLATLPLSRLDTEIDTPFARSTGHSGTATIDVPQDAAAAVSVPARTAADAERRQLTVMFVTWPIPPGSPRPSTPKTWGRSSVPTNAPVPKSSNALMAPSLSISVMGC